MTMTSRVLASRLEFRLSRGTSPKVVLSLRDVSCAAGDLRVRRQDAAGTIEMKCNEDGV